MKRNETESGYCKFLHVPQSSLLARYRALFISLEFRVHLRSCLQEKCCLKVGCVLLFSLLSYFERFSEKRYLAVCVIKWQVCNKVKLIV